MLRKILLALIFVASYASSSAPKETPTGISTTEKHGIWQNIHPDKVVYAVPGRIIATSYSDGRYEAYYPEQIRKIPNPQNPKQMIDAEYPRITTTGQQAKIAFDSLKSQFFS